MAANSDMAPEKEPDVTPISIIRWRWDTEHRNPENACSGPTG